MPDYTDPAVIAALRQSLDDPENWKSAAMPRRLPAPVLPGEFMKAPGQVARVGLPTSFGPYARAADEITTGAKDMIGGTGPAAEMALEALRKYVSKMF